MKFTLDSIQNITLFEKVTGSKVKDCFDEDGKLVFLVEEGGVKKAVLKLPKLKTLFNKELKIMGFSSDPVKFINNLLYPTKVKGVKLEDDHVIITCFDTKSKGKVFGREKTNLLRITELLKKYNKIKTVSVE